MAPHQFSEGRAGLGIGTGSVAIPSSSAESMACLAPRFESLRQTSASPARTCLASLNRTVSVARHLWSPVRSEEYAASDGAKDVEVRGSPAGALGARTVLAVDDQRPPHC